MLLWGLYMVAISVFVWSKLKPLIENEIVKRALTLTFLFSAIIVSFTLSARPDPFSQAVETINGIGLTPSLLSPWNLLHPPIAFLAYSSFIFPYAAGLAILTLKKDGIKVPAKVYWLMDFFMILGWVLTSMMIVAGSLWGYEENWSGFWAWDPVEIAALVMWSFSSIYFHSKSHVGVDHPLRAFTATLGWLGVAFASFIVRSGLLGGLHSYTSKEQMIVFGTMLTFSIIGIVYAVRKTGVPLIPEGLSKLKGQKNKVSIFTFWLLVGNVVANIIGLIIQIMYVLIYNNDTTPYAYYIILNGITLLALAILLPFCDVKLDRLIASNRKNIALILIPLIISTVYFLIAFMPSLLAFKIGRISSIFLLLFSIAIGTVLIIQIADIVMAFKNKRGFSKIGKQLTHLAIIFMLLSYFSADFTVDLYEFDAEQNTMITLEDYDIKISVTRTFEGEFTQVNIDIYDMSDIIIDTLILEEGLHNGEYYNSGDWIIFPTHDLFFHLTSTTFHYSMDPHADIPMEIHRVVNANMFRITFIVLLLISTVAVVASIKTQPKGE
jgi:cytochrome c-type biogenesis protein CcmF